MPRRGEALGDTPPPWGRDVTYGGGWREPQCSRGARGGTASGLGAVTENGDSSLRPSSGNEVRREEHGALPLQPRNTLSPPLCPQNASRGTAGPASAVSRARERWQGSGQPRRRPAPCARHPLRRSPPPPRLLAQLNETEAAFDEFWARHQQRLQQCLQLRHFEQDFREVSGGAGGAWCSSHRKPPGAEPPW